MLAVAILSPLHALVPFKVDLRVNRNMLSGSLPSEIGALTNLGMFAYVLRSNRFSTFIESNALSFDFCQHSLLGARTQLVVGLTTI